MTKFMFKHLKSCMSKILNAFGPIFAKNPTEENAIMGFFTKTLSSKDTSFAIIGIRCNSEESTGKRKMSCGQIYRFQQGYEIGEDSVCVNTEQQILNTLYDDFYNETLMTI